MTSTQYKLNVLFSCLGLLAFAVVALFVIAGAQNYRITENDNRLKAIEKTLKGDKYLCSVKHKILNTHINCDTLKNSQEQDKWIPLESISQKV